MRELARDLVTILRTEAKNQRTPPIDYVIAEDGGRMVHYPEPDIAMAELLEEVATALAVERAAREKAEVQLAEAMKALAALDRMSRGVDWIDQDGQARRWDTARRILKGSEDADWPESYIPISDLRTSPPLSREGEDNEEVDNG